MRLGQTSPPRTGNGSSAKPRGENLPDGRSRLRSEPTCPPFGKYCLDASRQTGPVHGWLNDALDPIVDPALGIDISSDEAGRLPLFGFTAIAGPVPPGHYRAWIYWTLSDLHNDGTGLGDEAFLPAGEFLTALPPFIVLPP